MAGREGEQRDFKAYPHPFAQAPELKESWTNGKAHSRVTRAPVLTLTQSTTSGKSQCQKEWRCYCPVHQRELDVPCQGVKVEKRRKSSEAGMKGRPFCPGLLKTPCGIFELSLKQNHC